MKIRVLAVLALIVISSCASKKDVLYLQDANQHSNSKIAYQNATIQPNDILKITVSTLVPEAAIPYNRISTAGVVANSVELMQLEGYLVTNEGYINYPILSDIFVLNLTVNEIEKKIETLLIEGGHLNNPNVNVRLLNGKFTVLGEVKLPGTYSFTEQNITILQALGYAGDLTIKGKRDDIIITRDVNGVREISHIDLTTTDFMTSAYYYIKPNDHIIVNPNNPKVKQSGYIENVGVFLGVISLALTITILVTK